MEVLRSLPWAVGLPVLKSSFYFWYNGTPMQKSRRGLLQSLLLQVLEHQPHLMPIVFPQVFNLPDNEFDFEEFPSEFDLTRALKQSLSQPGRSSNFIFFIDGLDEYNASEKDMVALVDLFKSLAVAPCVKFVLSSRPLPAFVHVFEEGPTLELRKLNQNDITNYVTDKLKFPLVQVFGNENPGSVERLIAYIVDSAEGVFRWVNLVVEAALEGLRHCNSLHELHEEVEELPAELMSYYGHMWEGIKPSYRHEASVLLQLVRSAALDEDDAAWKKRLENPYRAVTLFLATTKDPEHQVFAKPIVPLDMARQADIAKRMEGRIRSRSLGLLEFNRSNDAGQDRSLAFGTVQLANRSVAEFLELRKDILAYTEASGFDINTSLLRSFTRQIEVLDHEYLAKSLFSYRLTSVWNTLTSAIRHARHAEHSTGCPQVELLNHFDLTMQGHFTFAINRHFNGHRRATLLSVHFNSPPFDTLQGYLDSHWSEFILDSYGRPYRWYDTFLACAVRNALFLYVRASLIASGWTPKPAPESPSLDRRSALAKPGHPVLHYAVAPHFLRSLYSGFVDANMVELLLDYGANPNEVFSGWSPWQNALYIVKIVRLNNRVYDEVEEILRSRCKLWGKIFELLILHGADPNAYCETFRYKRDPPGYLHRLYKRYSALHVVLEFFNGFEYLEEVRVLRQKLSRMLVERGGRDFKLYQRVIIEGGFSRQETSRIFGKEENWVSKEEFLKAQKHRAKVYV